MKKFSKAPPARAERSERPARKTAGAGPKRSYARDGDAPKRAYAPRDAAAPKRSYGGGYGGDEGGKRFGARSEAPRRPYTPRGESDEGGRSAYGDPYQRAQRPRRTDDDEGAPRRGTGREPGRGFTVTLDPDVARVFRGDASVNKALRLVLQMMQVVEGPGPRGDRPAPRPRTGYQGTDEARGFKRKPRMIEDDDGDDVGAGNTSGSTDDDE